LKGVPVSHSESFDYLRQLSIIQGKKAENTVFFREPAPWESLSGRLHCSSNPPCIPLHIGNIFDAWSGIDSDGHINNKPELTDSAVMKHDHFSR
jgi:hypothetical protein